MTLADSNDIYQLFQTFQINLIFLKDFWYDHQKYCILILIIVTESKNYKSDNERVQDIWTSPQYTANMYAKYRIVPLPMTLNDLTGHLSYWTPLYGHYFV